MLQNLLSAAVMIGALRVIIVIVVIIILPALFSSQETYSRVARVCKKDLGGTYDTNWTSFFKARLVCSIPPGTTGTDPFYFDEIGTILASFPILFCWLFRCLK